MKDLQSFTRLLRKSPPAVKQATKKSRRVPLRQYGEALTNSVVERMEEQEKAKKEQRKGGVRTRKPALTYAEGRSGAVKTTASPKVKKVRVLQPPQTRSVHVVTRKEAATTVLSSTALSQCPTKPCDKTDSETEAEEDVCQVCREPEDGDEQDWVGCDSCWGATLQSPNRLLHVTSRDLDKPASECDLTTLVRRLGVTTSMKKACNREIRSFHCASVMSVLIHSDLVKKLETPVFSSVKLTASSPETVSATTAVSR